MQKYFSSKIFGLIFVVLFLTSCASTYHSKIKTVHAEFARGEYEKALEQIEKINPSSKDELVYLMDKGMILHALGKYKESNRVLTKAEDLSDVYSVKSATREVAGTLWSEEGIEYAGDKHERLMIVVIRMLNYVMMDDWNGALVEVRRVKYLSEKVYGRSSDIDNPFATYLSGIVWETVGKINSALIEYRQIEKDKDDVPYYGVDLKTLSRRLGFAVPLPKKPSLAWHVTPNYRKKKGQLIVIAETGRSPYYVSETVSTGYFTVSMPSVRFEKSRVYYVDVNINGKEQGKTYPFYDIVEDIVVAAKERQKRSFVRKMIKVSTQAGLYAGSAELTGKDKSTESNIAGIALAIFGLTMSAADKADERSWRTLPKEFQLARFYLKPGTYTVELVPVGDKKLSIKKEIEIKSGKPYVWLLNFPETFGKARKVSSVSETRRIKELRQEEKRLTRQVKSNPKNGNYKIALAIVKISLGNYDVDSLVNKALAQGAYEDFGIGSYVVMFTVKADYKDAIKWAKKGEKLELKEKKIYSAYVKVLNYVLNGGKKPQVQSVIRLNKDVGIVNGFNHYVYGLIYEKEGKLNQAVVMYSKAYDYGLIGKPIIQKIMDVYKKTDDKFKKSKQGVDIAGKFAGTYLENK